MSWIGIGILIAIGFYLAPLIITVIGFVFLFIIGLILAIFGGKK